MRRVDWSAILVAGFLSNCGEGASDQEAEISPAMFARSELSRIEDPAQDAGTLQRVVDGNTDFAFDLYHRLRPSTDNVLLSPLSLSIAMAMMWGGARGETETEIASVFHFTEGQAQTHTAMNTLDQKLTKSSEELTVTISNQLWAAPALNPLPAYLDLLAQNYGAGVGLVDFADPDRAADIINGWVADETNDRIPELIAPGLLDPLVTMVLTNAVYFKGKWTHAFSESATQSGSFHHADGTSEMVPIMYQVDRFSYAEDAEYQAASLPYVAVDGGAYEMTVVLPKGDLATFESTLERPRLASILAGLTPTLVYVGMPRFTVRAPILLGATLEAMGMRTAFDGADFSGISNPSPGNIKEVVHETFIEVTETGTEAAGATAIISTDGSASVEVPVPLQLDRPFLFFLRETLTGSILFMGRLVDPT